MNWKADKVIERLQEMADNADANYKDYMAVGREFEKSLAISYEYDRDCLLSAISLIQAKEE